EVPILHGPLVARARAVILAFTFWPGGAVLHETMPTGERSARRSWSSFPIGSARIGCAPLASVGAILLARRYRAASGAGTILFSHAAASISGLVRAGRC